MDVLKLAVSKHRSERCIERTRFDLYNLKNPPSCQGVFRGVGSHESNSATLVPPRPAVLAGFRCYTQQPGELSSAQGIFGVKLKPWKKHE